MTWKPTEGLKRADELASTIHCDIVQAGGNVTTLARHRMVQLLEAAIEKALKDGSESVTDQHLDALAGWHRNKDGLLSFEVPATADPVGFDKDSPIYFDDTDEKNDRWPPFDEDGNPRPKNVGNGGFLSLTDGELVGVASSIKEAIEEDKPKRGRPSEFSESYMAAMAAYNGKAELKPEGTPVGDNVQREVETAAYLTSLDPNWPEPKKARGRPKGIKGKAKKLKAKKVKKDLGREIEAQVETPADPPLSEAPA